MPNRPLPRNLRLVGPGTPAQRVAGRPRTPRAPAPPAWLSADAKVVWLTTVRSMIAARTWAHDYMPTLALFAVLFSEFSSSPASMPVTKIAQLRLLIGDLGLSPSHSDRVQRQA